MFMVMKIIKLKITAVEADRFPMEKAFLYLAHQ